MFQVQIVYSACCVIKTQDVKILCDPGLRKEYMEELGTIIRL